MAKNNKPKANGASSHDDKPTPASTATAPQQQAATGLPMLYQGLQLLNANVHSKIHCLPQDSFAFAAKVNYIPLTITEFGDASFSYPIVFAGEASNPEPVVVLGPNKGQNQFVDAVGKWRTGSYVPAYIRRYPFMLTTDASNTTLTLAADFSAETLKETDAGLPLYEGGKAAKTAENALQFCLAYHQAALATMEVCKAIGAAGILVQRSAEFNLPSGQARVTGFHIVDEIALSQLSDEKFMALRKANALPAIYTHILSMKAWRNLLV